MRLPIQLKYWLILLLLVVLISCRLNVLSKAYPLRIIYDPWPGFFPIIIAQEKGFFAQQGVTVEASLKKNSMDYLSDFNSYKYDGIMIALGTILNSSMSHPEISIILTIDQSQGADAVLANSKITSVEDLRGKKVGTRLGTFGELFIDKMLEYHQMKSQDIILTNADGEEIIKLIREDKIQAGSAWEPFLSQGIKEGLHIVFSSEQTPGLIPDVLAVHNKILAEHPQEIRAFIRAWFQAVNYWQNSPEEAQKILTKTLNIPPENLNFKGIKILNRSDNIQVFSPESPHNLRETIRLYADFFTKNGTLTRPINPDKLLNSSFLE